MYLLKKYNKNKNITHALSTNLNTFWNQNVAVYLLFLHFIR